MKILTIGLVTIFLISNGCFGNKLIGVSEENHTEAVAYLENKVEGKKGKIVTTTSDTLAAENIIIEQDSVFWQDKYGSVIGRPLQEIKTISISKRNTENGFFHGLLFGTAVGAGLGSYLILTSPEEDFDCRGADSICFTKEETILFSTMVFGLPSSLIGLIHGAATKTTDTYRFEVEK